MPLVETHSLTKRYGSFVALNSCSLQVERGEVFGLLGPNGAGKTTLLRLLMGFLRPSSGWARIAGFDCYRQSVDVHHRVAYVPGDVRMFPHMRGRDVLAFFSRVRPEGNLDRARQIADRLGLDLSRQVARASTGMRQKLALSVALSMDVELSILDEPTANLDPTVRNEVLKLVREAAAAGRTVLFSSHVLSEVEEVCQRVAVLRDGHLVHTQLMAELRRRHRIRATLTGPLPEVPGTLAGEINVEANGNGEVHIETPGELSPLLGWLATLPVSEMAIEPVRLQAIYDRYHTAREE